MSLESVPRLTLPLPPRLCTAVRIDLEKGSDGKWRIQKQEDSLPSDFGSSGLSQAIPGATTLSNWIKWGLGTGTIIMSRAVNKLGVFR